MLFRSTVLVAVIMNHPQQHQDSDAINVLNFDEDSIPEVENSDEDSEGSDAEKISSALHMPPPDTAMPELHKVSVQLLSMGFSYRCIFTH